jgi:hypothetical protein
MSSIWIVMVLDKGTEIVDNAFSSEDEAMAVRDWLNSELRRMNPPSGFKDKEYPESYAYILERTLDVYPRRFLYV